MRYRHFVTATFVFALASPALALQTPPPSKAQQSANHDFGKISSDGYKAFADIRNARLAIFTGNTDAAQQDITAAAAALQRAKSDDTLYTKAEDALTPPKGTTEPNPDNVKPGTTGIQWLPIEGSLTIDDDYIPNSAKAAGVAEANSELKAGNHTKALQTLKLAAVNVSFDLAVAPLDASITWVDDARRLAAAGQYFEANQALKHAQDGVRFDVQDFSGPPAKTASNHSTGVAAGATPPKTSS